MDRRRDTPQSTQPLINSLPVELLEEILFHLPIEDLIFAPLVCSRWHQVILGTRLQRALYLQPDPKGESAYGLNRLLQKRFTISRHPTGVLDVALKPEWAGRLTSCDSPSWRKMYIMQPPEQFMSTEICGYGNRYLYEFVERPFNPRNCLLRWRDWCFHYKGPMYTCGDCEPFESAPKMAQALVAYYRMPWRR